MADDAQSPDSPAPAGGRQITLQVGERRFITTRETLVDQSGFFASLLSGRWDTRAEDGSYFIDADATLFEHILRYLRRGVLPLFYDKAKGHDHALYFALLAEARFFQITPLEEWLGRQRYLRALRIGYSAMEIEGTDALCMQRTTDLEFYPAWHTEKVYVCARGIASHRGNRLACGRVCRNVQGDNDDLYEEERVLRTLVVEKENIFDMQACVTA